MLYLAIILTPCALYALYRLGDTVADGPNTACIPMKLRRIWSVAVLVLTIALYAVDSWWMFAAACIAHLGVLVCRNACIQWDKKRLHISGLMGIRWDYEYAQLRSLPGKLPLLVTNDHIFVLWPGLTWRDTFLADAREHVRVAAYAQRYRKRPYKDTRQNTNSRNAVMTNLGLALALGSLFLLPYWPITADTGDVVELTLARAWERNSSTIGLDFGESRDYRVPLNATTAALLEPEAVGKTYTVQRLYRSSGSKYGRSRWYKVIAISDEDGIVYRTWEQSAAALDYERPYRLAALTMFWFMIHSRGKKRKLKRKSA